MHQLIKFFLLSCCISCLSTTLSYSQSNFYLTLYQNSDFSQRQERTYNFDLREYEERQFYVKDYDRLSIGLGMDLSNGFYHEIEFSYTNNLLPVEHKAFYTENSTISQNFYSFQYEYGKNLIEKNRFKFSLGAGFNFFTSKYSVTPLANNTFDALINTRASFYHSYQKYPTM